METQAGTLPEGSIFELPTDDELRAGALFSTSTLDEEELRLRQERRMQSNRESARRSRMRKKAHYEETTQLMSQLREENGVLRYKVSLAVQNYQVLLHCNHELRMHVLHLSHRLQYLDLAYSTRQASSSVPADHVAANFEDWLLR